MAIEEIKIRDTVRIVPSDNHTDYIKSMYGKDFKVTKILFTREGKKIYKLAGVKGYGPESDIQKI